MSQSGILALCENLKLCSPCLLKISMREKKSLIRSQDKTSVSDFKSFQLDQAMSNEELILSPIHEAAKRGYGAQIEELLLQLTSAQEKEKLLASVDTYGNT